MKKESRNRWNILDFFLGLTVLLAVLVFYFSLVRPLHFSHLIKREGVMRFAEVEILLTPELSWMKGVLPAGEESRNVYGEIDWKVVEVGEVTFGGEKFTKIRAKVLIAQESSGILRYGKYTLVKGSKIFLINDHFFLEGRILNFRLLEEKILL